MADPVLPPEDVARIVGHMNEEHPEDLMRYAQVYGDVATVDTARMTGLDADGFDLAVRQNETTVPVRIDFETPLETVEDARSVLVELAMAARPDAEQ